MELPDAHQPSAGIFVDEIGIAIGIYGDWRLKAVFRPIFASGPDGFRAVAVEGSMRPFLFGREADGRVFRRAVPARDRPSVAALGAALCLRNLEHTWVEGLRVLLEADVGTALTWPRLRAAARALRMEAGRNRVPPRAVIVQLSQLSSADAAATHAALRAAGLRTAFAEKGDGLPFDEASFEAFPDVVTVDGDWFRSVVRQPATVPLFGALVRAYRSRGATVLVEGISTAAELSTAIEAGTDWVSGPLLAPAALAGAVFPEETVQVETLLDQGRVIPLFR